MALVLCKRVGIPRTRFSQFSFGEDSFEESRIADNWVFQAWIEVVGGLVSFFYRVCEGVGDTKSRNEDGQEMPHECARGIQAGVVGSRRCGNNGKVLARLDFG